MLSIKTMSGKNDMILTRVAISFEWCPLISSTKMSADKKHDADEPEYERT